jgi:hypothetical protein
LYEVKIKVQSKQFFYADDQVLITESEDELQMAAHRLNNTAICFRIFTSKSKYMGMCYEILRLKLMIEGRIIEQVTEFNYLMNKISEYKTNMKCKL